jgi:TP901 family phage tail tape measure protein
MADQPVKFVLSAVDRASGVFKGVARSLAPLQGSVLKLNNALKLSGTSGIGKIGASLTAAGDKLKGMGTGWGSLIAGAGLGAAVKGAADFESAFKRVEVITGASADDMLRLTSTARKLAGEFTGAQIATAINGLAGAGMNVDQVISALPGTLQFAEASQLELAHATELSTTVMRTFGFESTKLSRVQDTLAKAFSMTGMNVEAFEGAFQTVAPTAKELKIDFNELMGVTTLMVRKGMSLESASAGIEKFLLTLSDGKLAPEAAKALVKFGISRDAVFNKDRSFKGFANFLDVIKKAKIPLSSLVEVFGKRGFANILPLLQSSGADVREFSDAMAESEGTIVRTAEIFEQGIGPALHRLKNAFTSLFVSLEKSQLKVWFVSVVHSLELFIKGFGEAHPVLLQVLAALAALAAIMGPIVIVLGWFVSSLGTLLTAAKAVSVGFGILGPMIAAISWPVWAAVAAVVALVAVGYLLYKNWDSVKKFFVKLGPVLLSVFKAVGTFVFPFIRLAQAVIKNWSKVKSFFSTLWEGISTLDGSKILSAFGILWDAIKAIASDFWSSWMDDFRDAIKGFENLLPDWLKKRLGIGVETAPNAYLGADRPVPPAQAPNGGLTANSTSQITVDFRNAPPGMRVNTSGASVGVGVKYGLQGALAPVQ